MTQPTFNLPQRHRCPFTLTRIRGMATLALTFLMGVDLLVAALLIMKSQIGRAAWVVVKAAVHLMPPSFWLGGVLLVALWWGLLTQMWRAEPA